MAQERVSRDEWARRVQEWQGSGLSAAEYARRKRLRARSLTWWRWKLAGKATTTFVELHADEVRAEPIEVVLGNGRVVRVPFRFDDALLARVLSVAEGT
jgi:transposase